VDNNYWERNINNWSKLYLKISHGHEELECSSWLKAVYHSLITPIESLLMKKRYAKTLSFINTHVKKGDTVADLGCGTGIFVVELLNRGAKVLAIDYTEAALKLTKELVMIKCPDKQSAVTYLKLDLRNECIPHCDAAFAMGVAPYIAEIESFISNVMSGATILYLQLVDPRNIFNRLRAALPWLNVRKLNFHDKNNLSKYYSQKRLHLQKRENFATGYIDLITKV
jgi:cyclopropane fatty-acyl-phospholipid synthase-like methyltransferase